MCRLTWLPDEKLGKLPKSVQRMIKQVKTAEKSLENTLARIAPFLPKQKNGRNRLIEQVKNQFAELRGAQLDFCVASAYVAGVKAQDRQRNYWFYWLKKTAGQIENMQERQCYEKAYLESDWILTRQKWPPENLTGFENHNGEI